MVGRIGEMLCLQAESTIFLVRFSLFADVASVEEVARIELQARLGGQYIKADTGERR